MMTAIRLMAVATGLLAAQVAMAQAPPAGSTGQCKDGTYSTAASKQGACRGHQGVKEWYAAAPTTPATPAAPTAPTPPKAATSPSTPTPPPAPAAAPASAKAAGSSAKTTAAKTVAPGGGPGMVWLNTSSNVYHCYGGEDYGTTKAGAYMSEADAKAKGGRPDHGKACTK
jgi:uncharacterized protein DUF3761